MRCEPTATIIAVVDRQCITAVQFDFATLVIISELHILHCEILSFMGGFGGETERINFSIFTVKMNRCCRVVGIYATATTIIYRHGRLRKSAISAG